MDEILKLLNKIKESYINQVVKEKEAEESRVSKYENYTTQLN